MNHEETIDCATVGDSVSLHLLSLHYRISKKVLGVVWSPPQALDPPGPPLDAPPMAFNFPHKALNGFITPFRARKGPQGPNPPLKGL